MLHAPKASLWLCRLAGGATLLLLPGCPGDDAPVETAASSSSGVDPDTTIINPCDTGGCNDTTEGPSVTSSTSGSSEGTTGTSSSGSDGSGSSGSSGSSSSSSSGGESSSSSTSEGVSVGSSSSSGGEFETGVVFIVEPELNPGLECDLWTQDCPVGQKCMPWDSGSGGWDATGCFPVDPAPVPVGDTCMAVGSGTSGIDNCELGAMCWSVDVVTNEGTCVAMCTGSEIAPVCGPPDTNCVIANDGLLILCLPGCDPLTQDCPAGDACYPINDGFSCAPDASGAVGVDGDGCDFINVCDPGLMCAGGGVLEGCGGGFAGCCTPICDITDPVDPCPAVTEECVPFFELGMAPLGLEDVGICIVPA